MATSSTEALATSSATEAQRQQDTVAIARRQLPQPDGSLLFAEYFGDGRATAELNAAAGLYTASVDGMYVVDVLPSHRLASEVGFITLVQRHAATGTSVHTHVDPWIGGLVQLRENDTLCVVARPVDEDGAASRLVHALSDTSVSLRVQLAMRKKKRAEDLADLDEQEAEAAARAAAKRKRQAPGEEEGTGSETEWSEGFSSDDDARRQARPPKRVRALARAARDLLDCGGRDAAAEPPSDEDAAADEDGDEADGGRRPPG